MDYYFNKVKNKEQIYAHFILEQLRSIALRGTNFISCGAGMNMFAVNADKKIYSCMNFAPIPETSIGSIELGVNKVENKRYSPKYIDETKCNSCNIRYLCGGGCMADRYVNFQTTNSVNPKFCKLQNIIIENYLVLFQRIKNLNPHLIDNIANHKLKYEKV